MKRCPDVSHPSSLSHKHTLKPLCQESSGMFRAYVPDSFSQPRLLWRRNTHSHPGAETETGEEAWSSPRAGAWADAAWHAQKQSSVFLRRYVKHPVSGLTCFLFEGSAESRCDAPPGQCQPESVWEGGRKEGGDLGETAPSCCTVSLQETDVHSHKYWLFCSKEVTCCTVGTCRIVQNTDLCS